MAHLYLGALTDFLAGPALTLPNDVDLNCRHFFSGAALYVNNNICLTLTPVGLGLKLPAAQRTELLTAGLAVPLRYFPKAPIKQAYALFPEGLQTDPNALNRWISASIRFVLAT